MSFAHDFRDIVIPALRKDAKIQGALIALDETDFETSRHEVTMIAARAGLGLLPIDDRQRVTERIPDLIWDAYESALVQLRKAEQSRLRDPIAYYESIVTACRDPERMRWTFAAVDKVYRSHLLAERARAKRIG